MEQTDPDHAALDAKLDAVLEGQERIARLLDGIEAALLLGTVGAVKAPAPSPLPPLGEIVAATARVPISGEPTTLEPGETTPLPAGTTVVLTQELVVPHE